MKTIETRKIAHYPIEKGEYNETLEILCNYEKEKNPTIKLECKHKTYNLPRDIAQHLVIALENVSEIGVSMERPTTNVSAVRPDVLPNMSTYVVKYPPETKYWINLEVYHNRPEYRASLIHEGNVKLRVRLVCKPDRLVSDLQQVLDILEEHLSTEFVDSYDELHPNQTHKETK